MIVAFKDKSFAFEFVRNLGFTYYGGAEIGEMMATVPEIVEGDFESWFTGWDKRAKRVLARADQYADEGHRVSAREAYLRASTYFRMAEFYLHGNPNDPRIITESRASQQLTPRLPSWSATHGNASIYRMATRPCRDTFIKSTIPVKLVQP